MVWLWIFLVSALFAILTLIIWRNTDVHTDQKAWKKLEDLGASENGTYSPELVVNLPEPAKRYFNFTILPGTQLTRVAEIEMGGEIGMGTKQHPTIKPCGRIKFSHRPLALFGD